MKPQGLERTGLAIRKLRLAKGMTLAELAVKSGIPLSTLSRVELGQNALKYEKLVRICRALEVDLQGIVTREAEDSQVASGRRAVTRAGEGPPVRIGGAVGRRAAADLLGKTFSPVVVEVTARSLESHGPMTTLPGEIYVAVLSGEVEFLSHLYAPMALQVGDAVYFDGSSGFALVAPKGAAKILLVASGEQDFSA